MAKNKPLKLSNLLLFNIITVWEKEDDKNWPVPGGYILAKTTEDAVFLTTFLNIKCEELGVLIGRYNYLDEEDKPLLGPFRPEHN